jgi:TRAP-type C4-dicarboxylate transport system substrate-binding protein
MNRNCFLTLALFGILAAALAAGCGGKDEAAVGQKVITLKYAHHNPTTSGAHVVGHAPIAKLIEEKTNGKVKIQMYSAATLGKPTDAYEMVTTGLADIVWGYTGYMSGRFPLTEVVTLPMLGLDSAELGAKVLWDLYQNTDYLKQEYPGVHVILLHTTDGRAVAAKEPVKTMEDLQGMKFRANGAPQIAFFQSLGVSPVTVPITDLYQAAEKGVVKGICLDWEGLEMINAQEITKYVVDTNMDQGAFWLVMNQKTWERLPADVQKAFDEIGGLKGGLLFASAWDGTKQRAMDKFKKAGVAISTLTPAEEARWKEKAAAIQDKWAADLSAKGLPAQQVLAEAKKLIQKYKTQK